MIEKFQFLAPDFLSKEPKELALLAFISQSFFQPFSVEDNLLVILTALTSGSGIGFNRAMLFRARGNTLRGEIWLGPRSADEARDIWEILSTPGISHVEIIEHNRYLLSREPDSLSQKVVPLSYPLGDDHPLVPARSAIRRELILVRESRREPLVDPDFLRTIGVDEFLCVPLFSFEDILGVIILDNAYTKRGIESKDIKLASLCGLMASNYIYAATLHNKMIEMERMAALGEMAAFITHQLRNPLTAVGGFSDQLLNSPPDEAKTRRNIQIIQKEIKRLENVLTKLTRFLKADEVKTVAFDLKPVLLAVLDSPDLKMKGEGIDVFQTLDDDLPRILADPTLVGEALRNLLANAFEATPAGGRVEIRGGREAPTWVAVSVADSGRGMLPDLKEKVFTSFLSTKDKGLGLGLLFVKRVMDSCGGRIEVDSEAGRGTVFRLFFRCAEEGRSEP